MLKVDIELAIYQLKKRFFFNYENNKGMNKKCNDKKFICMELRLRN